MDSLPNSYSIYFPSGIPSVSFPLLNFLFSVFHSSSAFFWPCFPSQPLSLSSFLITCPFFLSLATIYPPLQNLALVLPLSVNVLFSPHPVWSGSQRSVWSAENSCWNPAGQRCQQPLQEQTVHGTPPWQSAGPEWKIMQRKRVKHFNNNIFWKPHSEKNRKLRAHCSILQKHTHHLLAEETYSVLFVSQYKV